MNIVVDTNIILSALIKDSITRKIIIQCNESLFSPDMALEEIRKHMGIILSKSGLENEDIGNILEILFKYIELVPFNKIKEFILEAKEIMQKIDPNDVVFVATALSKNAAIWSDDKDFQKQNKIKVFTTKDMIKRVK